MALALWNKPFWALERAFEGFLEVRIQARAASGFGVRASAVGRVASLKASGSCSR